MRRRYLRLPKAQCLVRCEGVSCKALFGAARDQKACPAQSFSDLMSQTGTVVPHGCLCFMSSRVCCWPARA